ncbi:MAG: glycosyltransferase family 9 protein [Brumimicrobium sp.]|nr:glycosyltransferase family 9 protein [Brumimicrobium sp.]
MKKINNPHTILISRTDSIGDVILTLPICSWLKEQYPQINIIFLGRKYTAPIIACFSAIDSFIDWNEVELLSEKEQIQFIQAKQIDTCIHVFPKKEIAQLMKKSNVKNRIGTSHRFFHWATCNIYIHFTRKNSPLHEAQLNFELLRPLGLTHLPSKNQIQEYLTEFKPIGALSNFLQGIIQLPNKKIILHPKSQGSAVEWPIENYITLAEELVQEGYVVCFSGTENEGLQFRDKLPQHAHIIDISGKSTLKEFITFISQCDALVACSTGPLHIAAILGIQAIGLYTDLSPMHPGRWAPIGEKALALTIGNTTNPKLEDITQISVSSVIQKIKG